MLLTFKRHNLANVLRGKTTTIRGNWKRWLDWYSTGGRTLNIYKGNPRRGGTKIVDTECLGVEITEGEKLTQAHAEADGFASVELLVRELAKTNSFPYAFVFEMKWAVISFDPEPIRQVLLKKGGVAWDAGGRQRDLWSTLVQPVERR